MPRIPASSNEFMVGLWPDDLPDVPMFLNIVAGVVGDDGTLAMSAILAAAKALRLGTDEPLNSWCEAHDPEWGQS